MVKANNFAVQVSGLRKRYGDKHALDGFDLVARRGEVCGLLGPNGAGKTTAVRILATLLKPDAGEALVGGYDVARQPHEVRRRIGLVGQNAAVDEILSGEQNLVMFGRLYHLGPSQAKARARELLDQFGLADTGRKQVKAYSGGMRRRLDLAAGMILAPMVLFLDEPTSGLDPRGRSEVWDAVRNLVSQGTTVLLTTQYLDEADQLAGHISVIDSGRVVAEGSPSELKDRIGGDRIDCTVHDADDLSIAAHAIGRLGGSEAQVDRDSRRISARVADPSGALVAAVRALDEAGIAVDDLSLRRPTLDEVFMNITSRHEAQGNSATQGNSTAQANSTGRRVMS